MAGTPRGYVVAVDASDAHRVLFSRDLSTWKAITLPMDAEPADRPWPVRLRAVAAGQAGFLAVGAYQSEPCAGGNAGDGGLPVCEIHPVAWVSSDGLTWRSSAGTKLPLTGDLGTYAEFSAAWAVGDGWDAAVESSVGPEPHGNDVLHSTDGVHWTRLVAPPLPDGADAAADVESHGGADLRDGGRLLWQVSWPEGSPQTNLLRSPDGADWEALGVLPGGTASVVGAVGPYYFKDSWLLAGESEHDEGPRAAVWTSGDLRAWSRGLLPDPPGSSWSTITAVADWGVGYIAVGTWAGAARTSATWLSPNGSDWGLVPAADGGFPRNGPVYLANGPQGLAGVGFDRDTGEDAQVWPVLP
jgi:hypothetical protein